MAWFNRLANLLRPTMVSSDIEEELRYHIDARTADNLAAGMSSEDARRDAVRRFGSAALSRERSYETEIFPWLETIVRDLRYGARSLRLNPLVSTVAVLSIALAIGASTAIFSVVHAVLLNPLPYLDPDHIVILWGTNKVNNSLENNTSVPNFEDWRKRTRALENLSTYREVEASFTSNGTADWIEYAAVYGNFFDLMGRAPVLGRTFRTDEPDGHQVVLSYRLWQTPVWRVTRCPRSDGGVERADVTHRWRHAAGIRLPFRKRTPLDSCFRDTGMADTAKRKRPRLRSHSRPAPAGCDPR